MQRRPIGRGAWKFWLVINVLFGIYLFQAATGIYKPDGEAVPASTILTGAVLLALSVALFLMRRVESGEETAERIVRESEEQQAKAAQQAEAAKDRAEAKSQSTIRKAERDAALRANGYAPSGYRGPKCPRCGCIDFQVLGSNGKPLSAGKAVVGHMVAGPTGMFIGAVMGKKGKYEALCTKCGKRFKFK